MDVVVGRPASKSIKRQQIMDQILHIVLIYIPREKTSFDQLLDREVVKLCKASVANKNKSTVWSVDYQSHQGSERTRFRHFVELCEGSTAHMGFRCCSRGVTWPTAWAHLRPHGDDCLALRRKESRSRNIVPKLPHELEGE